jgi:hypothetical protein
MVVLAFVEPEDIREAKRQSVAESRQRKAALQKQDVVPEPEPEPKRGFKFGDRQADSAFVPRFAPTMSRKPHSKKAGRAPRCRNLFGL